ncbi:MAG: hypothetical protein H0U85_01845 [Gemmatimonadales bacterium]|nr:hypothetical protein [Gemmatimonadales bacterium]
MRWYRFTKTVVVREVRRAAGDVVRSDELPVGSLESLLRMGQVVECPDPTEAEDGQAAADEVEPGDGAAADPAEAEDGQAAAEDGLIGANPAKQPKRKKK